ncbi:autotransporter domain-containing protein [Alsobacter sp. SYSU M60028]|uniref:Autotransporter domain-containing protein n=1 Tax=Alsobacter ponti TaxID=2962936 RepID=A0ABT1LGB4_9HYPH|nr:autotransporter domain-containing protein [Alsobacter ponti]MCP8940544.1 autotransporter domain-containing protein [Alsobacter ponti]
MNQSFFSAPRAGRAASRRGDCRRVLLGSTALTLALALGGPAGAGDLAVPSGTTVANTGSRADDVLSNAGRIHNFGAWTGDVLSNVGTIINYETWTGDVASNAGRIENHGAWTGDVTVMDGGTFYTFNHLAGGIDNRAGGIVLAQGEVDGPISNAGTFNAGGAQQGGNTFANTGTGRLNLGRDYSFTGISTLTNSSTAAVGVKVEYGATLSASAIVNAVGATITSLGTLEGATIGNAGTINAQGRALGAITNRGSGIFNVTGELTGDNTFDNTGTSQLVVKSRGSFRGITRLDNSSTAEVGVLVESDAVLGATNIGNGARSTMVVDGTLYGAVVNAGTLKGTGAVVGDVTVQSGGVLAPGSGVAGTTMSVAGALVFEAGSTYKVAVSPTAASRADVTGVATLTGGTVQTVFAPGSYLTRQYTILHANGGFGGTTFAGLSGNVPAGFRQRLSYGTDDVYLDLKASLGYGASLVGNPARVADALNTYFDGGGALPAKFVAVYGLTGDALRSSLSSLSGEAALGGQGATLQAGRQFLGAMLDPAASGRGDAASAIGGAAPALGYAPEPPAPRGPLAAVKSDAPAAAAAAPRWTGWAIGFGGEGRLFGDGATGAAGVASNVAGVASGFDYRVSPDTTLGLAFAGGGTNWSMKGVSGSGRSDFFQAGVYGATRFGPAYVGGALAFGNDWTTTSRVAAGDPLRARYQAQSWSGRLEGGYRFATSFGGLTPYAAVQAQDVATPAYAERNLAAGGFGLSFLSHHGDATRAELGARYDFSAPLAAATLTLRARAAYAHDWVKTPSVDASFQALPGSGFTTLGATPARDLALLSAGAELAFANGVAVFGKMEGEFSNKGNSWFGSAGVKYVW